MADRPHILCILSDEHRGQAMGHTGDVNLRTPAMDALAAEGVSFSQARSNCPICTPARGTAFSGRHAHSGPVSFFFDVYTVSAPSTATMLRAEGYHTAYFGKWHCGTVRNQTPQSVKDNPDDYPGQSYRTPESHRAGFQDWRGYECINAHFNSIYYRDAEKNPRHVDGYEPDGFTDLVIEYLRNYDRDEPLFLVLSPNPPHFPMEVPEEWNRWRPEELTLRPNCVGDESEIRRNLGIYYGMIENLDWNIGRLMTALGELPRFADTLTVYTSDHGDYMGSHGLICSKERAHEESVRIPAIFHRPGHIPAQGVRDEMFSLVDLLPTTLGLIGADVPPHVQGRDHAPALRGEAFAGPDAVLLEMCGNPRWNLSLRDWRGVVTRDWKYAHIETGEEWLFNLVEDPYEMNNLAEAAPEKLAEMRRLLLDVMAQAREPYYDVVMEYGVPCDRPDVDASQ
jgi:arylsulfatase A-like enzyme